MEYGLRYYIASVEYFRKRGGKGGGGGREYRALVPRVLAPAIWPILLTHNQSYWGNENLLPRTQESQTRVEMV